MNTDSVTSLALVDKPSVPAVVITSEQMELAKETVAKGATDAEFHLFVYDCRRRGVHPLDRLIHFTKRGGKYTPVTSIDMFRARAASTKVHMGTDDVIFCGIPGDPGFQATVTVYRLVQGEKCPFTATARMSEYMPESPNDFMWKKMPHGQLGKCAEALALRKGFPQELEGLHTFEEMEQAGPNDGPRDESRKEPQRKSSTGGAKPQAIETKAVEPLTVVGVIAKLWRPKDKKMFAVKLKDDGDRVFTQWIDKHEQLEQDLKQFVDTDRSVKLAYAVATKGDATFHNVIGVSIADAEPVTPSGAGEPITAGDIFGNREPGQED